jgi:5-hydroxyisourate hydrolase
VLSDAGGRELARATTDADGRAAIGPDRLDPGEYALRFETGAYFAALAQETFYPSATVAFTLGERPHVHVPLLLSPFAYSTYRGS